MAAINSKSDLTVFKRQITEYKTAIDQDIASYIKTVEKNVLNQYGPSARLVTDAFFNILARGGKRIRGSLVMLGYEMSGGKDTQMITQVARAVEMIHAYILIIDDIQDRSIARRGGPTANVMLADYHRKNRLADSAEHFGIALAINAALGGMHAAQMIIANIVTDEELRLKVLNIMNRTMLVTMYGQTNDIMNEVVADVDEADVDRVLEWKTAHYTFLNPLHIGMVLAGAEPDAMDAIRPYAIHAGKAFQITDDILGTFGTEFESGKSPMDDIREGKRTLLTVYALENAPKADKNFLIQMLGNHNLSPVEFERCKDILVSSGALDHAKKAARQHVVLAISSLEKEETRWSNRGIEFLRGLANYLLTRTA